MAGIGRYGVENGNALGNLGLMGGGMVSSSPGSITGCYGNLSIVPWHNHWLLW